MVSHSPGLSLVPSVCLERAWQSLEGLSVGDAFGEQFFLPGEIRLGRQYFNLDDYAHELIRKRSAPFDPPWPYTDDTQMALSIVSVLRRCGRVEQDALAAGFAQHFQWKRNYGGAAIGLIARLQQGCDWRAEAPAMFGGQGSFGNGSAMRVAPVGAYFADDLDPVCEEARRSAGRPSFEKFMDEVLERTPKSEVRERLVKARKMGAGALPEKVVDKVGSGDQVTSQDTVPFCVWCSAVHLESYEDALWATVAGLGDRDTTCAIVGGIVLMYTGVEAIPKAWRENREALPEWAWTEE